MQIHTYTPRFTQFVYASALPASLRDALRTQALDDWYACQDIGDGDFYYIVRFDKKTPLSRRLAKLLPPDVVAQNQFAVAFSH